MTSQFWRLAAALGGAGDELPPTTAVKSMLGETLGASGAFGTIALIESMRSGTLPGVRGLREVEDGLPLEGLQAEAREIFESMLACRNSLGLFSEDTDTVTGEHWGNYPQTYSLVGIINCAMRLSRAWQSEL